jgi:hypothetical protein
MLKPEHGQRRNAGERRTLARRTSTRRSGKIEDGDQAVARAHEETTKHWLNVEVFNLAAELMCASQ